MTVIFFMTEALYSNRFRWFWLRVDYYRPFVVQFTRHIACRHHQRLTESCLLRTIRFAPTSFLFVAECGVQVYVFTAFIVYRRTSPTCWRSKLLHVPCVLLMRHIASCREHGLNSRSDLSQSQRGRWKCWTWKWRTWKCRNEIAGHKRAHRRSGERLRQAE